MICIFFMYPIRNPTTTFQYASDVLGIGINLAIGGYFLYNNMEVGDPASGLIALISGGVLLGQVIGLGMKIKNHFQISRNWAQERDQWERAEIFAESFKAGRPLRKKITCREL